MTQHKWKSVPNSYRLSTGERIAKTTIDSRVRAAKKLVLATQLLEFGYNFCVDCGASAGVFIDCSHDVSVDQCQKEGRSELAWDVDNIKPRCRACHNKLDKLYLG